MLLFGGKVAARGMKLRFIKGKSLLADAKTPVFGGVRP